MTTLKPCPFCGEEDVKLVHDEFLDFARCPRCSATGPNHLQVHWNNRYEEEPIIEICPCCEIELIRKKNEKENTSK